MSLRIREEQGFGVTIIIVIILALGLMGLVRWKGYEYFNKPKTASQSTQSSNKQQANKTISDTKTTKPNVFKIPELGVEFDEVGGVVPVYYGEVSSNPSGPSHKAVGFSTKQAVDEGIAEGKIGNTRCGLDKITAGDYFDLADIYIYSPSVTASDIANSIVFHAPTPSEINPSNGYLNIRGQIFSIPTTYSMNQPCTNTPTGNAIEKQQFELLRQSLMTIRSIK